MRLVFKVRSYKQNRTRFDYNWRDNCIKPSLRSRGKTDILTYLRHHDNRTTLVTEQGVWLGFGTVKGNFDH